MAWEAKVMRSRGNQGGTTPPLVNSFCSIPVKHTNESASATSANGIHHQLRLSRAVERPESSSVWELSTHTDQDEDADAEEVTGHRPEAA